MDFCFFRQSDTYLKANLDTGLDTSKLDVEGTCAAIWTVPAASTVRNSRSSIFVRRDPVIILWTQAWHQRVLHFGGLCRDRPGGHRRNPTQNCAICSDDVTGSRGSLPGRFRFLSTRNAPAAQALHPSRALFLTFFFPIAVCDVWEVWVGCFEANSTNGKGKYLWGFLHVSCCSYVLSLPFFSWVLSPSHVALCTLCSRMVCIQDLGLFLFWWCFFAVEWRSEWFEVAAMFFGMKTEWVPPSLLEVTLEKPHFPTLEENTLQCPPRPSQSCWRFELVAVVWLNVKKLQFETSRHSIALFHGFVLGHLQQVLARYRCFPGVFETVQRKALCSEELLEVARFFIYGKVD